MLRRLTRWIEESAPRAREWSGERLDLQVPALGASLLFHFLVLLAFATLGYAVSTDTRGVLRGELRTAEPPDLSKLDTVELIETGETTMEPTAGSFAPRLSPLIRTLATSERAPDLTPLEAPTTGRLVLPAAARLDTSVSIRGLGSEAVGGVVGAVDRLAQEILRKLEGGRTLVVWGFDASGSLRAEREPLRKHIEEVYTHIVEAGGGEMVQAGGLLSAVVSFGKDRKILAEPTAEPAAVASAIAGVGQDDSGIETTFQTVIDIVKKYGKYRAEGQPYRAMIVLVTDEVGDDEEKLEPAIDACRAAKVPVYVLGSPAVFGRKEGLADYTDPKTGRRYQNLTVRQGPESAMTEGVRLPFWFDGPQYEYLDAGFGPYALCRLAGATGGIYFLTRANKVQRQFDPAGMREYRPDWVSASRYREAIEKSPIRQAVVLASQVCQRKLPGTPRLTFPAADDPAFKEGLTQFQEAAARTLYTVEEALVPINAAAKFRDKEPSRRWQAHYDLIRGRLLALRVRCGEYLGQCARMKREALKPTRPDRNAWRLESDAEVHVTKAAAAAREAQALLKKVVADHPGTPWALLAERELRHPLGLKWVEAYVPPRPPEAPANNAAVKKAMPKAAPPRPEEPPKL